MAKRPIEEVWFRTDEAWDAYFEKGGGTMLDCVDVRQEARALRFITSRRKIEAFFERHAKEFKPYTLYGSGDFHHLTAVWIRQFSEPFHLLSFDNHPDWDVRPPRWSCGAWVNRALENTRVRTVSVWGCGNFECSHPGRLLGNRKAAEAGRLRVHPWRQEGQAYPEWLHPITAESWREDFVAWAETLRGQKVYVTIDLDCLAAGKVFTNWEAGRFLPEDVKWAMRQVRMRGTIFGGDVCGGWSAPRYASLFQKLAGWFDHPRVAPPPAEERVRRLEEIHQVLWRDLAFGYWHGENSHS